MNFDFSEEQEELRRQARRFFKDHEALKIAREVMEGRADYDQEAWRQAGEMGWLGAAIPEDYGGVGLGALELCVLAEEIGRAMVAIPFSSSVLGAAEALRLAGSDAQREKWLPKLATGEVIGTLALCEPGRSGPLAAPTARLTNGKLSGEKAPVADAAIADIAIVSTAGAPSLHLVELGEEEVEIEPLETIDLVRRHGLIRFDMAAAEPLPGADVGLLEDLVDRLAVYTAFEALGGADRAMEIALAYAKERHAFGRPIGGNQAIKHKLADMFVKNQLARSHSYYGAWALSTGDAELAKAAAGARLAANQAIEYAAEEMVEIHGGIGFTWESDCQFFYRRARLLALNLGSKSRWADRLVRQLETRNRAAA